MYAVLYLSISLISPNSNMSCILYKICKEIYILSVVDCPQYTTKLCFIILLTSWSLGKLFVYFFLIQIITRFTVRSTNTTLIQNVTEIVMCSLCLFDIMFIQIPTLLKALKFSGPEPL